MEEAEARLAPHGPVPRRHAHSMSEEQWALNARLADAAGVPRLPPWRREMFRATSDNKRKRPGEYRDVWEDSDLREQALSEARSGRMEKWGSSTSSAGMAEALRSRAAVQPPPTTAY